MKNIQGKKHVHTQHWLQLVSSAQNRIFIMIFGNKTTFNQERIDNWIINLRFSSSKYCHVQINERIRSIYGFVLFVHPIIKISYYLGETRVRGEWEGGVGEWEGCREKWGYTKTLFHFYIIRCITRCCVKHFDLQLISIKRIKRSTPSNSLTL